MDKSIIEKAESEANQLGISRDLYRGVNKRRRTPEQIKPPLADTISAINEASSKILAGGTGEGVSGAFSRDKDLEALTEAQIAAAKRDLGYHD